MLRARLRSSGIFLRKGGGVKFSYRKIEGAPTPKMERRMEKEISSRNVPYKGPPKQNTIKTNTPNKTKKCFPKHTMRNIWE